MTATPEQRALAESPTTSAEVLQSLAAASPELWPLIAVHPNVYPDLLQWMKDSGFSPAETTASSPEPASIAEVAPDPEPAPSSEDSPDPEPAATPEPAAAAPRTDPTLALRAWFGKWRRVLLVSGGTVVAAVVAAALVMTLIVAPQQAAAEALAAAAAGFEDAVDKCEAANTRHATALQQAEGQTAVDPATMADPTVIDALRTEIDTATDAATCTPPAMAEDTATIVEQTGAVVAATRAVTRATDSLTAAADAVSRSVQEKRNAEAAAAAEAERQQQEAQRAARTWTMRNAQGYTFTASLEVGSPTTTLTVGDYRLGQSCGFDPALDIAIPVTMTVTSTTEGFETPISALTTLSQSGRVSTPHEFRIEAYYSGGPDCKSPSFGTTILSGVKWDDPMAQNKSGTHRFAVIIREWRTPSTPNGDPAFLDALGMRVTGGQNSGFTATTSQQLTLSNQVR